MLEKMSLPKSFFVWFIEVLSDLIKESLGGGTNTECIMAFSNVYNKPEVVAILNF